MKPRHHPFQYRRIQDPNDEEDASINHEKRAASPGKPEQKRLGYILVHLNGLLLENGARMTGLPKLLCPGKKARGRDYSVHGREHSTSI